MSPIWFAELGGDNKLKVSEINISEKFTYNINKHLDVVANLGYNSGVASRDIKKMAITSYNYAGTKINTKADGYKQEESSCFLAFSPPDAPPASGSSAGRCP